MSIDSVILLLTCVITGLASWSLAEPLFTQRPQNIVQNLGGIVRLDCRVSESYSDDYFDWRRYQSTDGSQNEQVYRTYNNTGFTLGTGFPASRFQRFGLYGLNIRSLAVSDGGAYRCSFYGWNMFASANVFVVVNVVASTDPAEFNSTSSGVLTCTATFSGPARDDLTANQFPQLAMTLAGMDIDLTSALLNFTYQQPMYYLVRTLNYTARANDTGKELECILSSSIPRYRKTASTSLKILTAPHSMRVSPFLGVYRVGDSITCHTSGYPPPVMSWQKVGHSGAVPGSSTIRGPVLRMTEELVGDNTWRCRAVNRLGFDELTVSFTVRASSGPGEPDDTSTTTRDPNAVPNVGASGGLSQEAKIGLGVGLGVGLFLLIVIFVIICCCCCCGRRKREDDTTTTPEYVNVTGLPSHQATGGKSDSVQGTPPPEYCPRPADGGTGDPNQRAKVKSRFNMNPGAPPGPGSSVNSSLDKSGYGDLGLGFDVVGTLPRGTETSTNRSLQHSPRRAKPVVDSAPLGYVNKTFTDDTGVSDRPTRGRRRSSGHDPGPSQDEQPMHSGPGTNWLEAERKPSRNLNASTGPDDFRIPSGLPRDTRTETPPGRRPGDRSFEIITPGLGVDDLAPSKPFESGPQPRNDASDRLQPPGKTSDLLEKLKLRPIEIVDPLEQFRPPPSKATDPVPTMAGAGAPRRSFENLAAPPGSRLNRSFDPSSYLPDRSMASGGAYTAGVRQGSAPDVSQRGSAGNTAIQFNTDTQAIDV